MKLKISDLWRWDGTIDRAPYVIWGGLLFALKFNVDRGISWLMFGKAWSVFEYHYVPNPKSFSEATGWGQYATLLAVALPFLWSGTVLTVRRLRSAGLPQWLVVLFVVPIVKFIFFLVLSLLPVREPRTLPGPSSNRRGKLLDGMIPEHPVGSAAMGIFVTLCLTVLATWLGTDILQNYGWSLFVGLPFCIGFFSVLIYGFHQPRTLGRCLLVAFQAVILAGVVLLLFAFEGALCLIMAAPLAIAMAMVGGAVAYAIQKVAGWHNESKNLYCSMLLLVPIAMSIERYEQPEPPLFKVTSSVEVNAPPEAVWRNVVTFSELPPPREWLFWSGIAYPVRAEIRGHGIGAVRYCNFSTGPFVEPIEVWDEPRLLKFSVSKNPPPMKELTFYHDLRPPHLNGFLVSRAGQFHLVPLPNGHTLLEGTTWYNHNLWPAQYWRFWSDYIIHRIHLRVLNHVKTLSETDLK
jgi:uncharacterized membrane protein YhaH (DUF805 family)